MKNFSDVAPLKTISYAQAQKQPSSLIFGQGWYGVTPQERTQLQRQVAPQVRKILGNARKPIPKGILPWLKPANPPRGNGGKPVGSGSTPVHSVSTTILQGHHLGNRESLPNADNTAAAPSAAASSTSTTEIIAVIAILVVAYLILRRVM